LLAAILGNACHTAEALCYAKPLGQITVAAPYNVPFVAPLANGHPVILLLDTGAEQSLLTPSAAERIGAQAPRVEFRRQMHGAAGSLSTREVELRSFSAGGVEIPWRRLLVAPVAIPAPLGIDLDGLLGTDVLSGFDIDLDLPHHRMMFYRKQSCQDAPPWSEPYMEIGTGRSRGEHLFFSARLDGRRIVAFVDTGTQRSILTQKSALALGITRETLERDPSITTKDAAGTLLTSHVHRFANLMVGSEVIHNPALVVTNVNLEDADVILGLDFLRFRRIWLSYALLRIFLSKP
jgi:predicted aspartyl protease